jgi:tellurite resistance protein TerC
VFLVVVSGMIWLDLFISGRRQGEMGFREALFWSIVWIGAALLFNAGIYFYIDMPSVQSGVPSTKAVEFLAAYILEKSLSVDNLFVFLMVFAYFGIGLDVQPRVLKWGIMGAIVMRLILLFIGVGLMRIFGWMELVFGVMLLLAAWKIFFSDESEVEPENNAVIRFFKKFMPITRSLHGDRFFCREDGVIKATPLFIVLLAIESSDLVFALDSIPAVLAISSDFFIVATSNIFAILGLRALYFLMATVMKLFEYLNYGIGLILAFVGVKMLIDYPFAIGSLSWKGVHISTTLSLAVIAVVLAVSVLASLPRIWRSRKKGGQAHK